MIEKDIFESEPIIKTFNMICDRLSNCEIAVDNLVQNAQFAELSKQNGILNNKLLGYPFEIRVTDSHFYHFPNDDESFSYKTNCVLIYFELQRISDYNLKCDCDFEISETMTKTVFPDITDLHVKINNFNSENEEDRCKTYSVVSAYGDMWTEVLSQYVKQYFGNRLRSCFMGFSAFEFTSGDPTYIVSFETHKNQDYSHFINLAVEFLQLVGHNKHCIDYLQIIPMQSIHVDFIENVSIFKYSKDYMDSKTKDDIMKKCKDCIKGFSLYLHKNYYTSPFYDIFKKELDI